MIGGDRDSQVRLAKYYFTLIDEMANLTRMDINQLKATLSQQTVTARLPYATKDVKMSRITSFWATTNRTDFLMDSQNVRWVIFSVEAIDHSYGNIWTGEFKFDINSLWAEAFYLYRTGFNCEMTKEDLATNEENNIRYHATSTEREMIMRYLEPASATDRDVAGYKKGQPSEVFIDVVKEIEKEALSEIIKLNDKYFYAELSKIAGWKKVAISVGGRNVQGYHYIVKSLKKNDLFNNSGTKLNNNDEKV
jgi:predicted P-loop ATPase